MDKHAIVKGIHDLINSNFPEGSFQEIYDEDKGSYLNYNLILDHYLGVEININFSDRLISFFMLKLKNGRPYGRGYSSNEEAGVIRLYFERIMRYFKLPIDLNETKKISFFKGSEADLLERVKDNLNYYRQIFQNENKVLIELHNSEVWEKIKRYR